jgi:hypothetical protein
MAPSGKTLAYRRGADADALSEELVMTPAGRAGGWRC